MSSEGLRRAACAVAAVVFACGQAPQATDPSPPGTPVLGQPQPAPPPELVERWEAQIATPYNELTDAEKESDREQVRRYLPLVAKALSGE